MPGDSGGTPYSCPGDQETRDLFCLMVSKRSFDSDLTPMHVDRAWFSSVQRKRQEDTSDKGSHPSDLLLSAGSHL